MGFSGCRWMDGYLLETTGGAASAGLHGDREEETKEQQGCLQEAPEEKRENVSRLPEHELQVSQLTGTK